MPPAGDSVIAAASAVPLVSVNLPVWPAIVTLPVALSFATLPSKITTVFDASWTSTSNFSALDALSKVPLLISPGVAVR